jgi:transcriptional regulator with XRE-family HTH domain
MENIGKVIGENIRRLRKAKRWTQTDLAVYSGVSFRGVQDIEQGKRTPRRDTVAAIAGALDTTVLELYGQSKIPAQDLTPETLAAIQRTSREAVKAAIEEFKGLPQKFEYAKPMSPKEELLSLIERLDSNGIDAILTAVRAALSSDPITSSALDEGKRSSPVRKRG